MIFAAIIGLGALALGMVWSALSLSRLGALTLPFQAGLITLIWLVPQLLAAEADPSLPRVGLVLLIGLAIAANLATWIGWNAAGVRLAPAERLRSVFTKRYRALVFASLLFVALSATIQVLMLMQPPEALASRQPSGLITILRTFASLNPVAYCLALTAFLLRPRVLTGIVLLVALACFAQELAVQVKRTSFFEIATVTLLALYAARGITIPRRFQITALPGAFLFLNLVHEVRRRAGFRVDEDGGLRIDWPSLSDLSGLDWLGIGQARASASYYEVTNGVLILQNLFETGLFAWGRTLWNGFVFRWVPGQIVGAETKAGMQFDAVRATDIVSETGRVWKLGTTSTGFAQPFADFAIFGVAVFLANALFAGWVFRQALSGSPVAYALAAPVLSASVVSLTHEGYALAFALPLLGMATVLLVGCFGQRKLQAFKSPQDGVPA